jgi:hypothetical protein
MALVSGGLYSELGAALEAHTVVSREISRFAPAMSDDDYVVDIAFVTGRNYGPNEVPFGASAGPVGRTQTRFIVWHRLPEGLEDPADVRAWFASVLFETESLVRDYLPRKSKAYPAAALADEVRALREMLGAPTEVTKRDGTLL